MLWKHVVCYSITTESFKSNHDYCVDSKPCLSRFVKRDRVLQTLFNPLSKLLLTTIHQEQCASSYILISSTKNAFDKWKCVYENNFY